MNSEKIENLPIEWKRGNGLRKSDLDENGKYSCVLYGELYTKHKNVLIDSQSLSKTDKRGKICSNKGDILVPGTSTAAKKDMLLAREINEAGVFLGGDINIIRPKQGLFAKKYLPYYFMTNMAYQQLDRYITGATGIIHISNKGIKNLKVPLTSFKEQQNIVKVLDKAFVAIHTAKANLEQNLKNTRELFESILFEKFTYGINIQKWKLEKLEKHNKVVVGYVGPISKEYTNNEDDILLLSTKNISSEGLSLKKVTRINHPFHNKQKKSQLVPGDILVARHGKSGQAAVIPENINTAHALNVIVIKKSKSILSEYIAFLLNSGVLSKIEASKGGSVQEIINTSVIKNLIIPIPDFEQQEKIIEELNNIANEIKKLESIYKQKLVDLQEMKKSILQKAFSGQLKNVS